MLNWQQQQLKTMEVYAVNGTLLEGFRQANFNIQINA
jgi:hypothetical protein